MRGSKKMFKEDKVINVTTIYEDISDLIPTKEECDSLNRFQEENLKRKETA
jgi:hypothetical protein